MMGGKTLVILDKDGSILAQNAMSKVIADSLEGTWDFPWTTKPLMESIGCTFESNATGSTVTNSHFQGKYIGLYFSNA